MLYSFEDYSLDPFRRILTRDGVEIPIGERAFSVLLHLVEHAGTTLTKQELMDLVWGDVAVVEDNLVKAIGEIRHALGDRPAEPHYVRTVHRKGYRFVCPVSKHDVQDEQTELSAAAVVPRRSIRNNRTATWTLAALVVIITIAGMVWLLRRDARAPDAGSPVIETGTSIASWRLRAMEGVPPGFFKPAYSPTGDLLVAVTREQDTGIHSLFLIDPGRGEPLRLTRDLEVRGPDPVFSADGETVWFTSYRHHPEEGLIPEVLAVPAVGGEPKTLLPNTSTASPHPGWEGFVAARVTADGTVIDVVWNDGREQRIADLGYWPRWSPDGQWIAFTTSNPEGGKGDLWVVRPDGTQRSRLTSNPTQMYGLCWSPDSRRLVFASNLHGNVNLWVIGIDGQGLQPVTRGPGQFTSPTFSHRRTKLAFAYTPFDSAVFIATSPWDQASLVTRETKLIDAAVSPDGSSVALATMDSARNPALSVLELATERRRVVGEQRCSRVRWAPDGQALLVVSPSPDQSTRWIWRVPLDGGPSQPLTTGGDDWDWPALSPDGQRLAAARVVPQGHELVIRKIDDGAGISIGVFSEIEGIRWSPDGRYLAWSGSHRPADSASSGIWVAAADADSARRVAADGAWPVWEPGSESLIFARFLEYDGLWRLPLAGGPPERVRGPFELEGYLLEGIDLASEGGPLLLHGITGKSGLYLLEQPED